MRRLAAIVALAAGLLVVAAIVGAIVRDGPAQRLSLPAFTAMARSIGVGVVDVGGGDRQRLLCGHLAAGADDALRRIDVDCRVSVQMAALADRLSACEDAACARETALPLVAVARQAEAIERRFAHDLRGDCATFFAVEADYDHGIAQAADKVAAVPGERFFVDAIGTWQLERVATEDAIDRQPIAQLLAACRP